MKTYIFIITGTEFNDYEKEIDAFSKKQAVDDFYEIYGGQFSKEFISTRVKRIGKGGVLV